MPREDVKTEYNTLRNGEKWEELNSSDKHQIDMKAKFGEFQFVEVDGSATRYGDLVGWITRVEYLEMIGEIYYHVQVYSGKAQSVFVAERFIRETERSAKIQDLMDEPAHK